MASSCCSANTASRLLPWSSSGFPGDMCCGSGDCVCCCRLAFDMALSPAERDRICCSFSRDSMSIGAIALPGTGWSGGPSTTDVTAVGDVGAEVDEALRALAARRAARRSIGVRNGPGTVDGSEFSVLMCGEDSGGVAEVIEVECVSDCEVLDEVRGVSEGVGVMDTFFSVLIAMPVTRGGPEARGGVGSGSGTLGGRSVGAAERAALAAGRPPALRGAGI